MEVDIPVGSSEPFQRIDQYFNQHTISKTSTIKAAAMKASRSPQITDSIMDLILVIGLFFPLNNPPLLHILIILFSIT